MIFFISIVSKAFSQNYIGTYHQEFLPKGAKHPQTEEIPIKLTETIICLKAFHQLKYIETNLDGSNPQVTKGKWKSSGKTIELKFQRHDFPVVKMEFLKLKNGEYLKSEYDNFYYYKKQ